MLESKVKAAETNVFDPRPSEGLIFPTNTERGGQRSSRCESVDVNLGLGDVAGEFPGGEFEADRATVEDRSRVSGQSFGECH